MATSITSREFPLVGIGASAGGIESFKRFLGAIHENSGMVYILVQHLSPSHESTLPEILARSTKIPVNEITDDCHVEPDHIYVIPENKTLRITDRWLKLTPREKNVEHMPIDVFFSSMAKVHGRLVAGIILSGTARDGTVGLRDIKEHGGITFAENPESAAWAGMPKNAIEAGVVHFTLLPEQIPAKLIEVYASYKNKDNKESNNKPRIDGDGLKNILSVIRENSGVDFNYYKKPTIRRRIDRRMAIHQISRYKDYLEFLRGNKKERESLFQDLLIKVTSYFRDPEIFVELEKTIFPRLLNGLSNEEPLRIWVAGCASGEEVYSLAIVLCDTLNNIPTGQHNGTKIQIFASDISETAIKKARTGIYKSTELQPLTKKQIMAYFKRTDGNYKVIKSIRDTIVFTVHNLLKDPPFRNIDLISCRNVFIYLDPPLQKKALSTFHYALKENGLLLIGKSETTGNTMGLFAPFSKNAKIYSKNVGIDQYEPSRTLRNHQSSTFIDKEIPFTATPKTDFRKSAETVLISDYTPASVIVDENSEIVHINGNIESYVALSSGRPNLELLKTARKELVFELRNALHKAKESKGKIVKSGILVKTDLEQFSVDLEVVPLTDIIDPHYLVLFWKRSQHRSFREKLWSRLEFALTTSEERHLQKRNAVLEMEMEMEQLREDMRSISEEQEAYGEELQSANEELLSSNEEMQSLNEELETSKEELHSTNEELIVINHELIKKQEELNESLDFLDDIIATMREPFLVLDKGLRIVKTNSSYYKMFNFTDTEVAGKLFFEVHDRFWDDGILRTILQNVLPTKERIIDEEIAIQFGDTGKHTFLFNAMEIVRSQGSGRLILLAIRDITAKKEIEKAYLATIEEFKRTNEQLDQFVHVSSHDLQEPLRKITTFATRITEKGKRISKMEMETYLDKIKSSSERMSTLIKNMLNYARLAHHEQLFEKTDLNLVIEEILEDFELLIEQKGAKFIIGNLPTIKTIPLYINQLFYNLIGNALKFSKEGVPPKISITSSRFTEKKTTESSTLDPNLMYYEIIVRDNGIGFNEKYSQKIFTIFQRLHSSNQYLGTGIGLALCKKIAEIHHGDIFAHSIEGEEAAFHILLPVNQPK